MAQPTSTPGVLFVATSTKIGGGTRVLMNVMTRLAPRYRPVLVAPGEGPVTAWARAHGVTVHVLPAEVGGYSAGRKAMWRYAAALTRLIVSENIRVLHAESPMSYRPVGLAGALTRRPRVCHLGFPPAPGELEWNFRFGPDLVIACYEEQTRSVAEDLARVRPTCDLTAIVNGVDLDRFHPRHDADDDWKAWRFGARHVVTIVGHLSDVKGYPTFLRAAARVASALPDCVFVSVGGETIQQGFRSVLERLAADLRLTGRLHFVGWQDDVAPLLRATDVLALPSLDEGLPLAILEAMASGVPVVATPVGGVPEAVVHDVTGLLVPPNDPRQLANALLRILRDDSRAKRFAAAARSRAELHFSLEHHADLTMRAYDRLVAKPRAARRRASGTRVRVAVPREVAPDARRAHVR